jgi:hypothetical protein
MWLYPLPSVIAFVGWLFLFATSGWPIIVFGFGTLALGIAAFFVWSRRLRQWPFSPGSSSRS